MKLSFFTVAILVPFFVAGSFAMSQELTATLNLRKSEGQSVALVDLDDSFEVVLKNGSPSAIVFPDPSSTTGSQALRFVVIEPKTKQQWQVERTPTPTSGDSNNSETATIELQPSDKHSFFVSLGEFEQGQRSWRNLPDPNSGQQLTIRAELNFESASAKSPDYPIQFVFARAELPQHYLWSGFPGVALKLLKADPKLIHRIDEDKRTPLHVAARFGHQKVLQWLLENGADIDAVAYNRFTPLHLASEPEIVRSLLKAGANPNLADTFGTSPLRKAIGESNRLVNSQEKEAVAFTAKWKQILAVYVEEGVEFELLPTIEIGDLKRVKKLLTSDASLLDQYVQNQQPLRSAVKFGELEIVRYLLSEFPDKTDVDNFAGNYGYPVSKLALSNGNPAVLEHLINSGANLQRRITWQGARTGRWVIGDNATLLHFAARDGSPEIIKLLLDNEVDPFAVARSDMAIGDQQTALHVATIFSKPENATAIIDHKSFQSADQAKRQKLLDECLEISASRVRQSSIELCSKLIEAGANIERQPGQPTLIQSATSGIHPSRDNTDTAAIGQFVELLEKAGIEIDLYSAVALQRAEQVEQILQQNPDLAQTRSPDGLPALHLATRLGDINTVRSLLAGGCDVNIQNQSKNSGYINEHALSEAAFWNRPAIAKLLIESGAEVNARTEDEITALHRAARLGNIKIVKLLLDSGADPELATTRGQTAADWATRSDIKALLKTKDQK